MPAPAHTPKAPPRLAPAPPTLPNELLNLVQQLTSSLSRLDEEHIPTLAQCSASLSEHEQLAQDIRHELGHVRKDLEVSCRLLSYITQYRRVGCERRLGCCGVTWTQASARSG